VTRHRHKIGTDKTASPATSPISPRPTRIEIDTERTTTCLKRDRDLLYGFTASRVHMNISRFSSCPMYIYIVWSLLLLLRDLDVQSTLAESAADKFETYLDCKSDVVDRPDLLATTSSPSVPVSFPPGRYSTRLRLSFASQPQSSSTRVEILDQHDDVRLGGSDSHDLARTLHPSASQYV
jgi:hypothetical protein